MALIINTNTASMSAQRQIMRSGSELDLATSRLSSGKRINSAADDAAGLAISGRMTSQIRGLDQAVRNANDGISMIQVAEGALNETTNMLQRIREISIQAANGIYSDGDRLTLNAEVKQLLSQIDFVSNNTEFNGRKILDGSGSQVDLQVGAEANQTVSFKIPKMDTKSLGITGNSGDLMGAQMSVDGHGSLSSGIPASAIKINGKAIDPAPVGTKVSDLLTSINTSFADIEASAMVVTQAEDVGTGILSGAQSLSITAVTLQGDSVTYSVSNTNNMEELVARINEKTGNLIQAAIGAYGKLELSSSSLATFTVVDSSGGVASGISLAGNPDPDISAIVQTLQGSWIAEAENIIANYFGISGDGSDLLLDLVHEGAGGSLAYIDPSDFSLNIDLDDFVNFSSFLPSGPDAGNSFYADRVLLHEMVHAVMLSPANNIQMATLPGWFTEGVAEFIHGADERVEADIASGALDTIGEFQAAFTAAQAVGSPSAIGYSAGYVAVKMLHKDIVTASGNTAGIKLLFDKLKLGMSLDAAITSLNGSGDTSYANLAALNADISANGFSFMTTQLNFTAGDEVDTGSIGGSDYGLPAKNKLTVMPNTTNQAPINFNLVIPAAYGGGTITADAQLVLKSKNGDPIIISKGAAGSDTILENLGFLESSNDTVVGHAVSVSNQANALAVNDLTINGIDVGAVASGLGLQAKVDAINKLTEKTSVRADLTATLTSRFNGGATKEIRAANASVTAPATGVIGINGLGIAITAGDNLQTIAANINNAAGATGVTAYVDDNGLFHLYSEGAINLSDSTGFYTALGLIADSGTTGSVKIKGIEINFTDITNSATMMSELNSREAQTGVHAKIDDNGSIVLSGSSAFNIALGNTKGLKTLHALGLSVSLASSGADLSDTTNNNLLTDESIQVNSRIQLTSLSGEAIRLTVTDNGKAATGLMQMNLQTQNMNGSSLSGLNVMTLESAQKAIGTVDNALKTINETRSNLGAINNRLDFTVANLSNISEKTLAALSRIVDTDFAQETAKLSRSTVIQQASQAMLAQANQRPQQVLSLLR